MSAGAFALRALGLLVLLGGFTLSGIALRRRVVPAWRGAPACLAAALLTVACLVLALELLGAARLFRAWAMVVTALLAGVLALRALILPAGAISRAPAGALRPPSVVQVVALLAAILLFAEWLVPTLDSLSHGIRTFDTLWYHLPWAASYAQTGEITSLRFTDVEYLTAFYPATAEMIHGAGIALLGRDTLSPLLNLVWLLLTLLGGWVVGSRRGLGGLSLLALCAVLATPMVVLSQAGSAANDITGIFFLVAGLACLLHGEEDEQGALLLTALACGLAVGTKLSLLAPAGLLWLGALVGRRGTARRTLAGWLGLFLIGAAFWYARNLLATGNPLPWLHLPGLPVPAPPLQAGTGFSVLHYLHSARFWSAFVWPGLRAGLGRAWPALALAAVLAPLAVLVAPRARRLRMPAAAALLSLLAYLATPESAAGPPGDPSGFAFNLRYSAPALALCACVTGLAPSLLPRRWRATGRILLGLALGALVALTSIESRLWPARRIAPALACTAATAAVALILWGAWRAGRRHHKPAAAAAALVPLACAAALYPLQRHYLDLRYRRSPGVSQLSGIWASFRSVHGERVGLVGTYGGFFAYPLWGLDLSDPVTYIALHGPHGSFTPITNCRAWRQAVDEGRYSLLVTTPARDPWHPRRLHPSPEAGWTRGDAHARLIARHSGAGATIYVFRLSGPLDPRRCG